MSIWIDKAGRRHVGIMQGGKRVHRILPPGASASDAKQIQNYQIVSGEEIPQPDPGG